MLQYVFTSHVLMEYLVREHRRCKKGDSKTKKKRGRKREEKFNRSRNSEAKAGEKKKSVTV